MKRNTKVLMGALAVTCGGVGFALATPITGEPFKAKLETEGPATVSIQDFSLAGSTPAQTSQNGWHSHPGMVVVTLLSGSIRWYDEDCEPKDYQAGDSWVEGSQLHAFRVTSTTPVHGMAVFITAQGESLRTDEHAPACGAGLGL